MFCFSKFSLIFFSLLLHSEVVRKLVLFDNLFFIDENSGLRKARLLVQGHEQVIWKLCVTFSSSDSKSVAIQLHLKCVESCDWIRATGEILANGKQVPFLPAFYGGVIWSPWTHEGNCRWSCFPCSETWTSNNDEKWWHQEPFTHHLPSPEALHPGLGPDSTSALWSRSSAPVAREFPIKLQRIRRGDGPSPWPIMDQLCCLWCEQAEHIEYWTHPGLPCHGW